VCSSQPEACRRTKHLGLDSHPTYPQRIAQTDSKTGDTQPRALYWPEILLLSSAHRPEAARPRPPPASFQLTGSRQPAAKQLGNMRWEIGSGRWAMGMRASRRASAPSPHPRRPILRCIRCWCWMGPGVGVGAGAGAWTGSGGQSMQGWQTALDRRARASAPVVVVHKSQTCWRGAASRTATNYGGPPPARGFWCLRCWVWLFRPGRAQAPGV
jgi:hypothetical protein